jgi:hypothetical protein
MKKAMVQLACALSLFLVSDRATFADTSSVVYLKNNIHVQKKLSRKGVAVYNASYANYTSPGGGHIIIPVNTPVTVREPWRAEGREILLTTQADGKDIHLAFNARNMRMQRNEYIRLITSPNRISLEGLSEIDRQGIAEGKPYEGMTKEGIRIALGYPAVHRTPSLDVNTWVYWKNRWTTMVIQFDPNGNVTSIWW